MVARRCPLFINATAMCIAIVVFPEPPFSFPTTMTCGNPRDFTAALSIAAPRSKQFHESQLPMPPRENDPAGARSRDRQLIEKNRPNRILFPKIECDERRDTRQSPLPNVVPRLAATSTAG